MEIKKSLRIKDLLLKDLAILVDARLLAVWGARAIGWLNRKRIIILIIRLKKNKEIGQDW